MTKGLIFWVLMLIWLVVYMLGVFVGMGLYAGRANALLEFILFLLLGWQVYGSPVK